MTIELPLSPTNQVPLAARGPGNGMKFVAQMCDAFLGRELSARAFGSHRAGG